MSVQNRMICDHSVTHKIGKFKLVVLVTRNVDTMQQSFFDSFTHKATSYLCNVYGNASHGCFWSCNLNGNTSFKQTFSELFFFLNFNAALHLLKNIKFCNFVYCCVRHRFSLFRTSCDRDDEKLPLKYIVERARLYVSLKLEKKTVTNCSVEKIIVLKYEKFVHGRSSEQAVTVTLGRTRFYVSLIRKRTVTNCSVEKIPLKFVVEQTALTLTLRFQRPSISLRE